MDQHLCCAIANAKHNDDIVDFDVLLSDLHAACLSADDRRTADLLQRAFTAAVQLHAVGEYHLLMLGG